MCEEPFFLSVRTAQRYAEPSNAMYAWRYLNGLVEGGVLCIVTKGTRGARGKATRYRHVADDQR